MPTPLASESLSFRDAEEPEKNIRPEESLAQLCPVSLGGGNAYANRNKRTGKMLCTDCICVHKYAHTGRSLCSLESGGLDYLEGGVSFVATKLVGSANDQQQHREDGKLGSSRGGGAES